MWSAFLERRARTPPAPPRSTERLAAREREVLTLISRGRSNTENAVELRLSEGTVKTHIGHILGKLDLRDRVQR